jgi:hypothetical protein
VEIRLTKRLRDEWSTASPIVKIFRVVVRSKGLIRPVGVAARVRDRIELVDDCPSSTFRIVELEQGIARPVRLWMKT